MEVSDLDALPAEALKLFEHAKSLFSSRSWYRAATAEALPAGVRPALLIVRHAGDAGLFPMQRDSTGKLASLTTPYTCLWEPLLSPGATPAAQAAIAHSLGCFSRSNAVIRLDALDAANPALPNLLLGFRAAGLHTLPFDHFGNWHIATQGLTWDAYLAGRPGSLREAIRRRTKKFSAADITVIECPNGLETGIAHYEQVYATSWKQPEPFPRFNAALMRECAAAGSLRLALLSSQGTPIAAQIWVVQSGWAGVLKLAHDETFRGRSPGTVLTALMIRRLLEHERVNEIDFGRGDDDYKKLWAPERRQRIGVLLANPWRLRGFLEVAREKAKQGRSFFFEKKKQKTFVS